jgi:hypothetical protein
MPRSLVALLAAVAAALAVLATLAPGYLVWVVAAAAGLVGYATAPDLPVLTAPDLPAIAQKNASSLWIPGVHKSSELWISIHKLCRGPDLGCSSFR